MIEIKKIPPNVRHCKRCGVETLYSSQCRACKIISDRNILNDVQLEGRHGTDWKAIADAKVVERRQLAGSKNHTDIGRASMIELEKNLPFCDERQTRTRGPKEGNWIYFIHAVGTTFIKIGVTANADINERLNELQVGCPYQLAVLFSAKEIDLKLSETQLHHKFDHLRTRGEWFKCEGELADFIKENLHE